MARILFDLDGTLVDSLGDITDSTNAALAAVGIAAKSRDEVRQMIGHGMRALLEKALGGTHAHRLEEAQQVFLETYSRDVAATTDFYPGVPEMLRALHSAGHGLAVATNKPAGFTKKLLQHLRADAHGIRAFASADEVRQKKPSADVVHLALARAGLQQSAQPLIYVGDMAVDVQTARSAGAFAVAVSWGFDPLGALEAKPDAKVDAPAELIAIAEAKKK